MLSKKTKSASRKRVLIILSTLLAINGGVANILINQINNITSTESVSFVKNSQVSAEDIGVITQANEIAPIEDKEPVITTYKVQTGDTLSGIAEKHGVSTNTIRWANDIGPKGSIQVGDTLTILPVTGIQYKVKSGDTVSGIAKKFDADQAEIISFNELEDEPLKTGSTIIIPDAEPLPAPAPKKVATKVSTTSKSSTTSSKSSSTKSVSGYFAHPMPGSTLTQGKHGYNSVDLGAPIGTPVFAAADGEVIVVKSGNGWHGGYGNYTVIKHDNGTQTLYAHLSSISVSVGENVSKGEQIAKSGNTGRSTGPHLHFEVRGGSNPLVGMSKGTKF